jgi:exodeoxyribonuclease X
MLIRTIDVESTGLAPPEHTLCAVGFADLVSLDGIAWDYAGGNGVLCDPGREIPPEASAVHHIVSQDVAGQTPWLTALLDTLDPVGSPPIALCAHNAKFERQWITADMVGDTSWICTWKCAMRIWPDAPGFSNQVLRYWRKLPVDRQIGDQAHSAFPDAYVTAHLLIDMLREQPIAQLIAWSNEPALLPKITFGMHYGKKWSEINDGYLDWMLKQNFDEDVVFSLKAELQRRHSSPMSGR